MNEAEAREAFAKARVARLATLTADGAPHVVPICFGLDGDVIYSAIDDKPKRTTDLQRLRNINSDARVAVLADHYDEHWEDLWWVRADGRARVVSAGEQAVALLARRYEQYRARPPRGAMIVIDVERWSGWRHPAATDWARS
jgi:PPOX class probable F420-dependent enzyme